MSSASCDLLDVNVLLAAAWPVHQFHAAAHRWLAGRLRTPWASCALTQLAFVRLSANPEVFKDAASPGQAVDLLRRITMQKMHVYWNDSPSIPDLAGWNDLTLTGHHQLTDAYLLSMAMHHGGRLATFDRRIPELLSTTAERKRWVELIAL
jgi:Predicted nucleic acid-binding protein, contains PIN domain